MRQNPDVLCMNVIKLFYLSIRAQSWSHRLGVTILYSEGFYNCREPDEIMS